MQNHKIFYSNAQKDFTSVSLISVYDSHVYGEYTNPFNHSGKKNETNMYCLILTLEGSANLVLKDGVTVSVQKNTAYFGDHASLRNMISHCQHWHMICYWFISQGLNIPRGVFNISDLNPKTEIAAVNKIIRLMQTEIPSKLRLANASFCYYLLELLEALDPYARKSSEVIDEMLVYINANIEEGLHVADIAQHFHYSEKHINHLFKSNLNLTPLQFINNIKLENACFLLATTSMTLQEIADKYCFASVSHFINTFKKKYGLTPIAYRNTGNEERLNVTPYPQN